MVRVRVREMYRVEIKIIEMVKEYECNGKGRKSKRK